MPVEENKINWLYKTSGLEVFGLIEPYAVSASLKVGQMQRIIEPVS